MEDDPRSRRLATSRTEKYVELVRQKVYGDHHLTVRMIANELGKSPTSTRLKKARMAKSKIKFMLILSLM